MKLSRTHRRSRRSAFHEIIDALEPRRMLAFTVQGTPGDDLIEMRVSDLANRVHEFRVNGQVVGTTQLAEIQILGLAGNDTFSLQGFADNIQGIPTQVDAFGGPGDDVYLPNSATDTTRFHESPGEGNDFLSLDLSAFGAGLPEPVALTLPTQVNSILNDLLFDDNLETKEVRYGEIELNLTVRGPLTPGLKIVLGNKKNVVKFVGDQQRIDSDLFAGQVVGGSNEDTVVFDDSAGNQTVNRDYTVTPTAFMNQSFTGVEKAEIKTRLNTTSTANTVFMTGAGTVTGSVTFSNAASTSPLTPTRLMIGTQAEPVDLDSLSLEVNAKFISQPQLQYEIFDQTAPSSSEFIINADADVQVVQKGSFVGKFNNTQAVGGAGISLKINGGSTADVFHLKDVLPLSRVTVNGGGGDDKLESVADATHGNAPEQVFLGTSFEFDGAAGSDTVDLDDRSAAFPGGVDEYLISTGFTKNGRLWMTHRNVDRVDFLAGGETNIIRIDTRDTPSNALDKIYSINAGSGNDTITTFVPGAGGGALGANVTLALVGGIGNDTLILDDTLAESPTDQYDINTSSFSYAGSGASGTFAFASVENVILVQNGRSSTTDVRGTPTGALDVAAGAGNDTVIVGGGDLDSSGLMAGGITLSGGTGTDNITFDDRMDVDTAGETETYTMGNLTIAKGAAQLIYSTFESQTLLVANGIIPGQFNTVPLVNLNAVSGFLNSTTITGGLARGCVVNVGVSDLNSISGIVNVNNATSLTVNDAGQTFGATSSFEINNSQVRKTSNNQTINYSAVGLLMLNARNSTTVSDSVFVRSVPAGTSVIVNANAGNDNLFLGNGNLDADVLGPVTFHAAAGIDNFSINNGLDTTVETIVLNATSIIDGQTHTFTGVDGTITVSLGNGATNLTIDGTSTNTNVTGGNGNDTFTVGGGDFDFNFPATVAKGLFISAGGGTNTLLLNDLNDTNVDAYFFQRPNGLDQFLKRDGGIENFVTWEGVSNVTLDASNAPTPSGPMSGIVVTDTNTPLRINGNAGNDFVQVLDATAPITVNTGLGDRDLLTVNDSDGVPLTVIVDQSDDVENLLVRDAGTLRVTSGAVLTKTRLADFPETIKIFGVLDLAGGALLSRAGGPPPAFRSQIITGRNGGAWNGTSGIGGTGAINSSLAAASASSDGVGQGLGSEIALSSIGGFAIAAGDTLIRYALDGDADLNGITDIGDFSRVAANFNGTGKVWTTGDSNYDSTTDIADFSAVAANFNMSIPVGLPRSGSMAKLAARFSDRLIDDVLP